jgi:hypothetical protein
VILESIIKRYATRIDEKSSPKISFEHYVQLCARLTLLTGECLLSCIDVLLWSLFSDRFITTEIHQRVTERYLFVLHRWGSFRSVENSRSTLFSFSSCNWHWPCEAQRSEDPESPNLSVCVCDLFRKIYIDLFPRSSISRKQSFFRRWFPLGFSDGAHHCRNDQNDDQSQQAECGDQDIEGLLFGTETNLHLSKTRCQSFAMKGRSNSRFYLCDGFTPWLNHLETSLLIGLP